MKKKKLILILIFILISIISTNVLASNFNTELEINNKTNNEIIIVFKATDINFENTMSTIEGNIEYDKNVFEEINIENLNEWNIVYNNGNNANGKFIGFKINNEKIKQEELFKISLKLKQNIQDIKTQIKVKNIKSADGDNLVSAQDKTLNINIKNSNITETKEEKNTQVTNKNILKVILMLIIIILVLTIITSIVYLTKKYKAKKEYKKIEKEYSKAEKNK